ncbi:MAG: hypothetical protein LBT10_06850 [Methanobrevibacter sp.]|jgi:predicted P-loop ATPase|nr:hypothetical protein [Methanobrevibacter sp.]
MQNNQIKVTREELEDIFNTAKFSITSKYKSSKFGDLIITQSNLVLLLEDFFNCRYDTFTKTATIESKYLVTDDKKLQLPNFMGLNKDSISTIISFIGEISESYYSAKLVTETIEVISIRNRYSCIEEFAFALQDTKDPFNLKTVPPQLDNFLIKTLELPNEEKYKELMRLRMISAWAKVFLEEPNDKMAISIQGASSIGKSKMISTLFDLTKIPFFTRKTHMEGSRLPALTNRTEAISLLGKMAFEIAEIDSRQESKRALKEAITKTSMTFPPLYSNVPEDFPITWTWWITTNDKTFLSGKEENTRYFVLNSPRVGSPTEYMKEFFNNEKIMLKIWQESLLLYLDWKKRGELSKLGYYTNILTKEFSTDRIDVTWKNYVDEFIEDVYENDNINQKYFTKSDFKELYIKWLETNAKQEYRNFSLAKFKIALKNSRYIKTDEKQIHSKYFEENFDNIYNYEAAIRKNESKKTMIKVIELKEENNNE